jgi:3-oxoacyl-[acyl-carrier protein] reductase
VLLEGKNAVIYGAGGGIGGAVARTFAREGARVFLAGPSRASLDGVAHNITAAGGAGEVSEVDALDEHAIESHARHIIGEAGRIDISFNLVGVPLDQGRPLADLSIDEVTVPIAAYVRTHFLTARAAAPPTERAPARRPPPISPAGSSSSKTRREIVSAQVTLRDKTSPTRPSSTTARRR